MSGHSDANVVRYRAWDFALESNVDLPELPLGPGGEVVRFRMLDPTQSPSPPAPLPRGERGMTAESGIDAGDAAGVHFHFPGLADFVFIANPAEIRCHPLAGAPPEALRHLLLDCVLPVMLSQRGNTVLHASAVDIGGAAVAFLGKTGRGKSTLCASFADAGCPVLADDCLLVRPDGGPYLAVPSYAGLRLWPTSVPVLASAAKGGPPALDDSKRRLGSATHRITFSEHPLPLHRIYVVGTPAAAVAISPMTPAEGMIQLVAHSYRLDDPDRSQLAREFSQLIDLNRSIPPRHLVYPRNIDALLDVREAVRNDMEIP